MGGLFKPLNGIGKNSGVIKYYPWGKSGAIQSTKILGVAKLAYTKFTLDHAGLLQIPPFIFERRRGGYQSHRKNGDSQGGSYLFVRGEIL